jgi:hypothetical protein
MPALPRAQRFGAAANASANARLREGGRTAENTISCKLKHSSPGMSTVIDMRRNERSPVQPASDCSSESFASFDMKLAFGGGIWSMPVVRAYRHKKKKRDKQAPTPQCANLPLLQLIPCSESRVHAEMQTFTSSLP